jgi:hypothetical protein
MSAVQLQKITCRHQTNASHIVSAGCSIIKLVLFGHTVLAEKTESLQSGSGVIRVTTTLSGDQTLEIKK